MNGLIDFFRRPKIAKRWKRFWYAQRLRRETKQYNQSHPVGLSHSPGRCLYASPVGKNGKPWLQKLIERFGHDRFDYLIFAYDDVALEEEIFQKCRIVREKGLRWYFLKKYVTPAVCAPYDYIFLWPDDIDVRGFDPVAFVETMRTNNLELAQPALTEDSFFSWDITRQSAKHKIGRYVDFVEIMVPVFTREAWARYWDMLESDGNHWGWGYDIFARAVCGYTNLGIIDCLPVQHVRPIGNESGGSRSAEDILNKYGTSRAARHVSYGPLQ